MGKTAWLVGCFASGLVAACAASTTTDPVDAAASKTSSSAGGAGAGGATSQSSSSTTGGLGPEGPPAEIVTSGAADRILLRGTMLTPGGVLDGELLVEGAFITCVAASCADQAGASGATVIETFGLIAPGMIDTHNHVLFNIFDETDWTPSKAYGNHDQWPNEARYGAMVDAKQYLNGQSGSPVNFNCELNKYGELKALVAGTTSMVGAATPGNKVCYRSLARTIDQTANGLCGTQPPVSCTDKIQANTIFPSTSSANKVCSNFEADKTRAFLIHVGEGVDQTAKSEFKTLSTVTEPDGCLYSERTVIVHGTAFNDEEFDVMAEVGMGLVWSPRSNVFLYGSGTDLSKTTDIPAVLSRGIDVALAPDWSLGGSKNLLQELRFADRVDNEQWGDQLNPEALVQMVTSTPAKLLGVNDAIGSLEVGKRADIVVLGGDVVQPYRSVVEARPEKVRLVMVDGASLYGDGQLATLGGSMCETLDVCGRSKFVCVAIEGGEAKDKLGQTFAEIVDVLSTGLEEYDQLGLSPWSFAPLAPLVECGGE